MSVWPAKAVMLTASVVLVVIRAPHGRRSRAVRVVRSRKDGTEIFLLILAWLGFLAPLVWIASPLLAFADYPSRPVPLAAGAAGLAAGLWLFHRSHADLGPQWSATLEIREGHRLVTDGVYRRIRHPMYLALLLYAVGQALAVPNRVAGPSYLVACALLVALRLGNEERMMLDEFGADYETYRARSKRLIPGLW